MGLHFAYNVLEGTETLSKIGLFKQGCAIAQEVSSGLLIGNARVRAQFSPRWTYVVIGQVFL